MIIGAEGVQSAVDFNMQLSPAMALAKGLPEETVEAIKASFSELFEQYHTDSVVAMPAAAWLITARNEPHPSIA